MISKISQGRLIDCPSKVFILICNKINGKLLPGFLGEGPHRYAFLMRCPVVSAEDEPSEWRFFEISEQAPLQPKPIYLRLHGLSLAPLSPSYLTGNVLHPQQPIIAVVHYVGLPKPAAELAASECEVVLLFDDTGRRVLAAQEPRQP